jgi:hypothetical protein
MSKTWMPVKPAWLIIITLSAVKLIIHLLTNTHYGFHRDEYLYLAFADHLDFGYFSNGPAIGFIAWLSRLFFGTSVLATRLAPALSGAVTVLLVGWLVLEMNGKNWAIVLAGAGIILSPAYLRVNGLFQPVSFDLLFWLLATFIMFKLVQTENPKYWLALGLVWSFGFLNKYSIAFLALGFFLALAASDQRRLLVSRYFFYHLFIGFILIVPNLLWQYDHNWPVLFHMQNLQRTQLMNVRLADFLLAQPLMTLPAAPLWIAGLYYFLVKKEGHSWRVFAYTFFVVLIILTVLHGKSYYTLGLYFVLIAGGAVQIEKITSRRYRLMKPGLLLLMLLILIPGLPYSLPVLSFREMAVYGRYSAPYGLSGFLRWEDGNLHDLPQDYADMAGWRELAQIVISTYQNLNAAAKEKCFIYGENYGQAGAVKYYGKKAGLPEPISFGDNFLFWAPDTADIQTLIYIGNNNSGIVPYFASVEEVGRITNLYARESGLPVFLCQNPRNGFTQFYQNKSKELKKNFYRELNN